MFLFFFVSRKIAREVRIFDTFGLRCGHRRTYVALGVGWSGVDWQELP